MKAKILHVEASNGWGGQEIRILREAEGMRQRGHEVFFAIMNGGILATRARDKGFVVYELNFYRYAWLPTLFHLQRILSRHQIDIVNTHSSLDSWIGGIAARLKGKKIIRTRHFSTAGKGGWNSRMLYGFLADFVVTACTMVIQPISTQSGKPKNLFRALPTGVDPQQIEMGSEKDPSFRKHMGITDETFLIGTVCVMRSWKGVGDFIKAAAALKDRKEIKWVIVGGGHDEPYRKLVRDLQLEENVFFTGHLENPFPAMQALDAFALLSTANEGVPQSAQQAAYLGKPLIATPTGGLAEICIDGVTGLQVPAFDPSAVASAVIKLKEDRSMGYRLGAKGRALILERYTFQQTLDGTEEVYREILQDRK